MKTPITSDRMKEHIRYNWWKYLLIAVIGFGLVDLLYSVTAYRPPREKTVTLYVYGYMDDSGLNSWLEQVREAEMPDMETVSAQMLLNDETYGPVQLMTYFGAGEGDIYLLAREEFLNYAANSSLLPLEENQELMALFDSAGISLQSGWRRDTATGETHLFGIPQDTIPGLGRYAYAQDGFLCLPVTGRNQENAEKLMHIICRDMITEPVGQDEQSESQPTQNEQP